MKVYTYYQNTYFQAPQQDLLHLWKKSWERQGFEAIVLNRTHAEQHPLYKTSVDRLNDISVMLTGQRLSIYGIACWLRWFAYATQPEEKVYVCDYDVINHNCKPTEPDNMLRLLDHCCPCIASGTPSQFNDLCYQFVDFTEQNIEKYIKEYPELNTGCFHDQEFFTIANEIEPGVFHMSRDREKFLATPIVPFFWKVPLVHYGTELCKKYLAKQNETFTEKMRAQLMRKFILKSLKGQTIDETLITFITDVMNCNF